MIVYISTDKQQQCILIARQLLQMKHAGVPSSQETEYLYHATTDLWSLTYESGDTLDRHCVV